MLLTYYYAFNVLFVRKFKKEKNREKQRKNWEHTDTFWQKVLPVENASILRVLALLVRIIYKTFHFKYLQCSRTAPRVLLRESLLCRSCLESFLSTSTLWSKLDLAEFLLIHSGSFMDSVCSSVFAGACSEGVHSFLSLTESLLQDAFWSGLKYGGCSHLSNCDVTVSVN